MAVVPPNTTTTFFVAAVVSFGKNETTFESMPALFGMDFDPPPKTYSAHLQFLPNNTKLCDPVGLERNITIPANTSYNNNNNSTSSLPIVLLVERGECSFEQKAINVMQQYPTIGYMVVYDNIVTKNLVAMRETLSGDGIDLGMLFVSNNAGMTLRAFFDNQTEDVFDAGGPIILLDGKDPPMYRVSSDSARRTCFFMYPLLIACIFFAS